MSVFRLPQMGQNEGEVIEIEKYTSERIISMINLN